ncbi:MAG: CoB--CoM heterodisulfide reductase subunit C [Methanobacterium sp.]|jgi:heterodisulfide reductase subunit C
MKQLKRLKNMLLGEEKQKETDEQVQQSESEIETKSKETVTPKSEIENRETDPKQEQNESKEAEQGLEPASPKLIKEEPKEAEEKVLKVPKKVEEKPKTTRSDSMTLLEGRDAETITRAEIDVNFKQAVIDAGAETLSLCFQCGTCTGACPSGRRTPYRVRTVIRRALMGFKDDLISDDSLWMCSTCYECQERCPRGIKIVDIVKIARNYAAQAGYMAKAHKMTGSYVIKTGHGVPINDATKALRKRVGLNELPPTTHEFPEALEEVRTILKATKFDNLIGYNWETGELE